MKTNQPKWRYVGNIGDVNPLEYGGFFVYRDATGVYAPEAELLIAPEDNDRAGWTIYRFSLDRLKAVTAPDIDGDARTVHLVPFKYNETWPHPLPQYAEWFARDLASVAGFIGATVEDTREQFYSADPMARAHAYRAIGDYYGYGNLDSYPDHFAKRSEVARRCRAALRHVRAQRGTL